MATFSMTDVTTWVHGHDFTTDLNKVSFKLSADDLDRTTFGGGGYKARAGGLKDAEISLEGFYQAGSGDFADPLNFADLGVVDRVITVSPTGLAGSTAYMAQLGRFKYEMFGDIGDMTPFSLDCMGTNKVGVVRGQVAIPKGTVSATGAAGSAVQLGAAGSSQFLYATLHVFSAGTTISVKLQSDDNSGFSSPTDVASATIGPVTSAGGTWMTRVAGPITDTYFRFNVTAVTGSFSVAGAIGVQ